MSFPPPPCAIITCGYCEIEIGQVTLKSGVFILRPPGWQNHAGDSDSKPRTRLRLKPSSRRTDVPACNACRTPGIRAVSSSLATPVRRDTRRVLRRDDPRGQI